MARSLLTVGLDPALMHASESTRRLFPSVDAEVIRTALARTREELERRGFEMESCFIDYGQTAEAVLRERLGRRRYDCVLVAGGVRLDPELTPLFQTVVNVVRETLPDAALCFNTDPTTTLEAVARQFPDAFGRP